MATLVGVPAARSSTAASARVASWRRPALRTLSVGLFLLAWHAATLWDLDLYVRFQNIPSPGDVLAEAAELFGSPGFYVHILASLERIWLGFAIVRLRRGHLAPAHRAVPSDSGGGVGADQHHALAHRAVQHRVHHHARRVLSDRAEHHPRSRGHRPAARARGHEYAQIVVGMLTIGVLGMLSSALIRLIGARFMPWLPRREKEGA